MAAYFERPPLPPTMEGAIYSSSLAKPERFGRIGLIENASRMRIKCGLPWKGPARAAVLSILAVLLSLGSILKKFSTFVFNFTCESY